MHVSKKMSPFFSDILLVMYRYPKCVHTLCENVITKLPTTKYPFSMVFWLLVSQTLTNYINMNLMIYCESVQFGLWRVKHCVWSWGESELIKYKFLELVKLSIVITSLYNTSLKSGYFWHSIKKWISFSTQSTVQCCSWWWHWALVSPCFNFQLMASNSKIFTVIFSGDCLPWWTNRAQLRM